MKKVLFLSKRDRIADFLTYPIRKNLRALKARGYRVKIKYGLDPGTEKSDILCINSKLFQKKWSKPDEIFLTLERMKKNTGKLIWFDDSDSTGITHFELLSYVDLYLKKQLFRDMSLYTKSFYGDRIFTDYYHREFSINDFETPYQSQPLDMSYEAKVGVSWHIGLGDMERDIYHYQLKKLIRLLPARYPSSMWRTNDSDKRPLDFMFRGTRKYARPTVSFHREKLGEILDGLDYPKVTTGKVSLRQYRQDIRDSKMVVSPFGWGELGVRDFECWLYGACLIKPDMSHMKTWPNIFVENETYAPITWDFSNVESVIEDLLMNPDKRESIARAGQDAYKHSISKQGMNEFCDHFQQLMEL